VEPVGVLRHVVALILVNSLWLSIVSLLPEARVEYWYTVHEFDQEKVDALMWFECVHEQHQTEPAPFFVLRCSFYFYDPKI
jgi:hypothetical protein